MSTLPVTDLELMLYVDGELDPSRLPDVEAELARSPRARQVVASIEESGALLRAHVDERAKTAGADSIVHDVMSRLAAEGPGKVVQLPARTARPGAQAAAAPFVRSGVWYAVGGLAAAAAAALVIWRLVGSGLTPQPADAPRASAQPPQLVGTEVASARSPAPDVDPEPSVSVDAVDFGARTGTIFYVPADKGTMTIVWLSDDESGGM